MPQEALNEVIKYKPDIMKKARIDEAEFNDLMPRVGNSIHIVDLGEFLPNFEVV